MRSPPNRVSKELGVSELKANLRNSLRRVKAGGEVIITERGLPERKRNDTSGQERNRLERLAKVGLIIPPQGKKPYRDLVPPTGDPRKGASVLEALIEERRTGR